MKTNAISCEPTSRSACSTAQLTDLKRAAFLNNSLLCQSSNVLADFFAMSTTRHLHCTVSRTVRHQSYRRLNVCRDKKLPNLQFWIKPQKQTSHHKSFEIILSKSYMWTLCEGLINRKAFRKDCFTHMKQSQSWEVAKLDLPHKVWVGLQCKALRDLVFWVYKENNSQ